MPRINHGGFRDLGEKVRKYREQNGLSQQQLASQLGFSKHRIQDLERDGRASPDTRGVLLRRLEIYDENESIADVEKLANEALIDGTVFINPDNQRTVRYLNENEKYVWFEGKRGYVKHLPKERFYQLFVRAPEHVKKLD